MSRLSPILIVPDVHAPFHDVDAWELLLDVARDLKPETIVLMGDLMDCFCISAHSKSPERVYRLKDEVLVARELLAQLDELGAIEKVYLEGNHEDRLARYISDKAPELYGLIDIPKLLKLEESGWEWVPYRTDIKRGAVHYAHDIGYHGKYAVYRTLDGFQHSNITAHTHRLCYIVGGSAVGEAQVGASFGWLGDVHQVTYTHRAKAKREWATGFGIAYLDKQNGHTHFQPVPIVDGRCVVNAKLYRAPRLRKGKRVRG